MGQLSEKMLTLMRLRRYSRKTQQNYPGFMERLVLRGGRHFLLTRKKGRECLNLLLAIAQIAAGLHVEVKHKAFYPIAVAAFGTD